MSAARMMRLLMLLTALGADAQDRWADAVIAWQTGPGGGFGAEFLPGNVLGPPDPAATFTAPSNSPNQLYTPGDGGWIVLAFHDNIITDGPGPDLRICENAFRVGGNPDQVWAEPAIVDLSADGVEWHTVPWDSVTHAGLAGRAPVNGAGNPDDPEDMGGDLVDLAAVGLDQVAYVRLRDLPGDGRTFDLDAVGGVRLETATVVRAPERRLPELALWPNPSRGRLNLGLDGPAARLDVYTIGGRRVDVTLEGSGGELDLSDLPSGSYFLDVMQADGTRRQARFVLGR
jgi:hypothetical protein